MKKQLKLQLLDEKFCLSKFPQFAEIPSVFTKGEMCFVIRTDEELAVVSPEFMAPTNVQQEVGWRCMRVEMPGQLREVGIIASLATPLADAGVPIFMVSTFNTDYLFVTEEDLVKATQALQKAGHEFIHKE